MSDEMTDEEISQRRDKALRRALNTPPKQHKDMKKGTGKGGRRKRQEGTEPPGPRASRS
jgi:hypothetical protein